MSTIVFRDFKNFKNKMFTNETQTISGSELQRPRKRAHESAMNTRSKRQKDKFRFKALDVSDLVSLFNEHSLFDGKTERIYVKDKIGQEFIDRIGKPYKPVLMKQQKLSNNQNLLIEYDIMSLFQDEMLTHCFEKLLPPFSNVEDIVMRLAIPYLGEAFSNNESLSRSLCEYINTMTNGTVGNVLCDDEDSEYDTDTSLGNFRTQKKKRRKLMSAAATCMSIIQMEK